MNLGIKGKRALVTGSTAGIGFATARGLVEEGAEVTINGRTAQRVNAAVEQIRRELPGSSVSGVAADLGTAEGCATVIRQRPELDIPMCCGVRLSRHYLLARTQGVDVPTVEREFFQTARPSSILQRFASLNEVASMIVYVCSERASATTGAALRVDGGVIRSVV